MSRVIGILFLALLLSGGRADAAVEDHFNHAMDVVSSNPWPWVAAAACLGMVILWYCCCCSCNSLHHLTDEANPVVIRCSQEVRSCHFSVVAHHSGFETKEAAATHTGQIGDFLGSIKDFILGTLGTMKDIFLGTLAIIKDFFLVILDEVESTFLTILDFISSWFKSGKPKSTDGSDLIGRKKISESGPLGAKRISEAHPWVGKKQPGEMLSRDVVIHRNVPKDGSENLQLPAALEKSQAPIGESIIVKEETNSVSIGSHAQDLQQGKFSSLLDGQDLHRRKTSSGTSHLLEERGELLSRNSAILPVQAKTYLGDHRFDKVLDQDKAVSHHQEKAVRHHRTHYLRQEPTQPARNCIKEILITAIFSICATSALLIGVYVVYQRSSA